MSTAIAEMQLFLCPHQKDFYTSKFGCIKLWKKSHEIHQKSLAHSWSATGNSNLFESSTLFHCITCEIGKKLVQGEETELFFVPLCPLLLFFPLFIIQKEVICHHLLNQKL